MKCVGAGEMLVASAYDFEDSSYPRPELQPAMEAELEPVLDFLVANRWPFRFHCTYEESAQRILRVVERVGARRGLEGLNWIFDHGETIGERTMEWIARLHGGISCQNRLPFQAREYRRRYGEEALRTAMPVRKMMRMGLPLAAGTDATRVSSYNPWLCIHWLVSGRGRGGDAMWNAEDRLTREEALRHWTEAGAWFSREAGHKGVLKPGALADLPLLDRDFYACDETLHFLLRHIVRQIRDQEPGWRIAVESAFTLVTAQLLAAAISAPQGPATTRPAAKAAPPRPL